MSEIPRLTLADIMALLRKADDDPDSIDGMDLGELTKEKVEAYHDMVELFRQDALSLKERSKEFDRLSDVQNRKADRIEERLRREMQNNGFQKLPGHHYVAVLGKRKDLVITRDPTVTDRLDCPQFVDLKLNWRDPPEPKDLVDFRDKIEVNYKWKKDILRQAVKDGDPKAQELAHYEEKVTFKWDPRREI